MVEIRPLGYRAIAGSNLARSNEPLCGLPTVVGGATWRVDRLHLPLFTAIRVPVQAASAARVISPSRGARSDYEYFGVTQACISPATAGSQPRELLQSICPKPRKVDRPVPNASPARTSHPGITTGIDEQGVNGVLNAVGNNWREQIAAGGQIQQSENRAVDDIFGYACDAL